MARIASRMNRSTMSGSAGSAGPTRRGHPDRLVGWGAAAGRRHARLAGAALELRTGARGRPGRCGRSVGRADRVVLVVRCREAREKIGGAAVASWRRSGVAAIRAAMRDAGFRGCDECRAGTMASRLARGGRWVWRPAERTREGLGWTEERGWWGSSGGVHYKI